MNGTQHLSANDRRYTKAKETRTVRDTAAERLYCPMVTHISANIVTGLDTEKVSTSSKTAPDITATGGADTNTVKEPFGTLTERDTKVRKNVQK